MEQEYTNTPTPPGASGNAPEWKEYNSSDIEELLKVRDDLEALKAKPHTFANLAKIYRRLSEAAAKLGGYYLAVPEALLLAGQQYFSAHVEAVRDALTRGGADEETTHAVLFDYCAALCGLFNYTATPEQMQIALKACKPLTAYNIDKYGFYIGLLYGYQRNLNTLAGYQKEVKQEPDAANRDLYFNSEFTDLEASALYWLQNTGYITAGDFAGVEQDTITRFLSYVQLFGQSGQFMQYVYIARYALNATPEQLQQLNPPALFAKIKGSQIQAALKYADLIADEITQYLERVREQVEAALSAPTPEEREQATEQARNTAQNVVISVPGNMGLILSRDVYGATDGRKANKILPVSAFIAEHLRKHPEDLPVTPFIIQKAVEGVNLLQQLNRVQPANGIYTLKTNLTEFSNLCGYTDANEEQKQQLKTALLVLSGFYAVIWKPNGRFAVNIMNVREFGVDKGNKEEITLDITADAVKGRPQFLTAGEFSALRKAAKGAAQNHFRYQILTRGHKSEEALLNEVFGYDTKIFEATGNTGNESTNPAGVKAAREDIRKHKPRDKKTLARWFEEYAQQGVISYTKTDNKKGGITYSWKRLRQPTPDELAALGADAQTVQEPAPDEQ